MMNDNQFKRNYMDFVNRVGTLSDIAYRHVSKQSRYNEVKVDRLDALTDAVFDITDMAYNDGSDYFMWRAIEHAEHMFTTYKQTTNYHDAEYYKYYMRCMKKYREIYLMCMTY